MLVQYPLLLYQRTSPCDLFPNKVTSLSSFNSVAPLPLPPVAVILNPPVDTSLSVILFPAVIVIPSVVESLPIKLRATLLPFWFASIVYVVLSLSLLSGVNCQVPSDLKNLVASLKVDAGTNPETVPVNTPGLLCI